MLSAPPPAPPSMCSWAVPGKVPSAPQMRAARSRGSSRGAEELQELPAVGQCPDTTRCPPQVHLQTQQEVKMRMMGMALRVVRTDGVLALYNGLSASLCRQVGAARGVPTLQGRAEGPGATPSLSPR